MTVPDDKVIRARNALGRATRRKGDVEAARRELAEAKIERAIEMAIAEAPPLSEAQRGRLAALLLRSDATHRTERRYAA